MSIFKFEPIYKKRVWGGNQFSEMFDPKIDKNLLFDDILAPYFAFRKPVLFQANDLEEHYRSQVNIVALNQNNGLSNDSLDIGSNNWVISGSKNDRWKHLYGQ